MKCGDCGATSYVASRRSNVCVPCFENRLRVIEAMKDGRVSEEDFRAIQRSLGYGRGTGKRRIEQALAKISSSSERSDAP